MKKAEIHKDFKTGDLTIVIPEGINLEIIKNETDERQTKKITEILITEELIWDNGKYLGNERFTLDQN